MINVSTRPGITRKHTSIFQGQKCQHDTPQQQWLQVDHGCFDCLLNFPIFPSSFCFLVLPLFYCFFSFSFLLSCFFSFFLAFLFSSRLSLLLKAILWSGADSLWRRVWHDGVLGKAPGCLIKPPYSRIFKARLASGLFFLVTSLKLCLQFWLGLPVSSQQASCATQLYFCYFSFGFLSGLKLGFVLFFLKPFIVHCFLSIYLHLSYNHTQAKCRDQFILPGVESPLHCGSKAFGQARQPPMRQHPKLAVVILASL